MDSFIDVFYVPNADPQAPYRCFVWESGDIVETARHQSLELTVEWCQNHALPVRAYNPKVRAGLRSYNIEIQSPASIERAVGE
jgi:hypothetical protein